MKTVLVYSGGLDSTVLLYSLRQQGHELLAISIDYGQRHRIELEAAADICRAIGVPHTVVDLCGLRLVMQGSSQTDNRVPVPHGHYEAESMKLTVVPNRNMVLMSVATAYAISKKADAIAYAAHAGDHAIYPDCRPEFADAMDKAVSLCDWHTPAVLRPFITLSKTDIVAHGAALEVPFRYTWSCYDPQRTVGEADFHHCGKCGTCVERATAFHDAGIKDPTLYRDSAYFKSVS